jgi:hypothetical protein
MARRQKNFPRVCSWGDGGWGRKIEDRLLATNTGAELEESACVSACVYSLGAVGTPFVSTNGGSDGARKPVDELDGQIWPNDVSVIFFLEKTRQRLNLWAAFFDLLQLVDHPPHGTLTYVCTCTLHGRVA